MGGALAELGPTGALGYGIELAVPSTAKTVRVRDSETIVTDGPSRRPRSSSGA